ncbi:Chromatin modification-related protein YNG2 [Trichinella pseudospiralis]|uniref:Chromatin modification-related protein YNG2 n=1 Tax=Trichinella pseudospiralis TaxID=6337 RepID=A0A0V1DZL6_TRIPS|nr:Chromatin modification-related protein YNG2 [Trichinella pseudospiralis]KRZ29878.1 Chromatin modification-related protein YNG2 [Trichinella pseudospiralis]
MAAWNDCILACVLSETYHKYNFTALCNSWSSLNKSRAMCCRCRLFDSCVVLPVIIVYARSIFFIISNRRAEYFWNSVKSFSEMNDMGNCSQSAEAQNVTSYFKDYMEKVNEVDEKLLSERIVFLNELLSAATNPPKGNKLKLKHDEFQRAYQKMDRMLEEKLGIIKSCEQLTKSKIEELDILEALDDSMFDWIEPNSSAELFDDDDEPPSSPSGEDGNKMDKWTTVFENDNEMMLASSSDVQPKCTTINNKEVEEDTVPAEEIIQESEDTTLYCCCQKVAYGVMIECEAPNCPYQWFHLPCVRIKRIPKGTWMCRRCRAKIRKDAKD